MSAPLDLPQASRILVKRRRTDTWWFAIAMIPILLLATSNSVEDGWFDDAMELVGYSAVILCVLGRAWCSVYIGGRKNSELVAHGPYSVVRNPLYVFSFIGVVGIGLGTSTFSITTLLMVAFALYYRKVVQHEEQHLSLRHGPAYAAYMASVPRWVPRFDLWQDANELVVRPRAFLTSIRDSAWFFAALPALEMLDMLHTAGVLPVLVWLP